MSKDDKKESKVSEKMNEDLPRALTEIEEYLKDARVKGDINSFLNKLFDALATKFGKDTAEHAIELKLGDIRRKLVGSLFDEMQNEPAMRAILQDFALKVGLPQHQYANPFETYNKYCDEIFNIIVAMEAGNLSGMKIVILTNDGVEKTIVQCVATPKLKR